MVVNHRSDLLTQDLVLTGMYQSAKLRAFGLSFDFPYVLYEHATGDIPEPVWQLEEFRRAILSAEQYDRLIASLEDTAATYRRFLESFAEQIRDRRRSPRLVEEYFDASLQMAGTIAWTIWEAYEMLHAVKQPLPAPHEAARAQSVIESPHVRVPEELLCVAAPHCSERSS